MYGTFAGGGPNGVPVAYGSNAGGGATEPGWGVVGASEGAAIGGEFDRGDELENGGAVVDG